MKTIFGFSFCFLLLVQSISYSQPTCCCGSNNALPFPGLDFEFDPIPPPNSCNTYYVGPMSTWNVTVNCVDVCGPLQANQGLGNPNGPSNYCDLNNTTASPCGPGTIQYPLTGLVPGDDYIIEWYHSKSQIPTYCVANCKIANGAWLDVTWEATTLGNVLWLKASYTFTAQASSAILQFSDAGSTSPWQSGVQIDDIKIYGCSNTDKTKPVINNPPADITVGCIQDVPKVPKLDYSDNCDTSPILKFKETVQNISPCRIITREWIVTDACGNSTSAKQIIEVNDQEKPVINNPPQDIEVDCDKDTLNVPKLVITDNCDINPKVTFRQSTLVIDPCTKKVTRDWTITDACGNSTTHRQIVDIIDKKPFVQNPPNDTIVECEKDIPPVPTLDIHYNCDIKPKVEFTETPVFIDACTTKITREWTITDACGNSTSTTQVIDVVDTNPPQFLKLPDSKLSNCNQDLAKEFNDWIKKNGNAIAIDACGMVTWRADYDHLPNKHCDTVIVEFIAKDHCGNESSKFANFIVSDTIAVKFTVKAESKNYVCVSNTRDSLRNWLSSFGYAQVTTGCDTVIMSSDFNGDSTLNPLQIKFYAKDRCGNIDSCTAGFSYRSNNDTLRVKDYSCNYPRNSIDTLVYTINGCDSIVIHEKIKILSDSTYFQLPTCNALQKIFDTLHLYNIVGCDSLVFMEYVFHDSPITKLQKSDCSYTKPWTDTLFLKGQYCDSLVITENIPLRKDSNLIIQYTCDKNKVDTTIQFLTNSIGCDSIVTIYSIFTPQKMTYIDTNVCGLTKSFKDTLKFTIGLCDSLIIKTYNPLASDTTHIQSTTCNKLNAGIFSTKMTNRFGCDSLIFNEVLLNPSDSVFISNSSCILSQSGIKIQKHNNRFGCDSIVQITTNFIPSDTIHINQTSCRFSDARSDTLILKGTQCDSVIFTVTTFIPSDTIHISQSTCDPTIAGLKTKVLKGTICDSVVYINSVLIPPDTTLITKTSCNPTLSGFTKMVLQNSKGCDSLIFITTNFVPVILQFELDSISCFNQNDGNFRITNSSDFSKPLELFLNNNKLGDLDEINNLSPGIYEIYVRDQKGCLTDSIRFILKNPEALIIDLGNDLEVKKGTNIQLNLQSNRILQKIFWQPSNLTNCNKCDKINFIVNEDTWVYAQAIDERNCTQSDSIFIRVKKSGSVFAPNSFSPNGDNINDYFFIQGDPNAIVELLFIYDRWGNKVFETKNVPANIPTFGWNGTFNSEKMNPGVFVFYAKVKLSDSHVIELKGDLTLIR